MRDETPVLIGAGQFTYRGKPENSHSPLELLKIAAERTIEDAGLSGSVLAELDAQAVIAFSIDAPGRLSKLPPPRVANPPASLARAVCATSGWGDDIDQAHERTGDARPGVNRQEGVQGAGHSANTHPLLDLKGREGVGRTGVVWRHPDGVRNLLAQDVMS